VARNCSGIGVVASAGRKTHDEANGLSREEFLTLGRGRSTGYKGENNYQREQG